MLKDSLMLIVNELKMACEDYEGVSDGNIIESIMESGKIFVAGAGRTGYIMRCFAMRLVHLGFSAYVIGDTEMIAAGEGDLLIIGSGSGETGTLQVYMNKAVQLKMKTVVFTCNRDSAIARKAEFVCAVKAQEKWADENTVSIQPMGSLFEQMLLIITDCIILQLAEEMGVDFEQLRRRHSNLE